MKRFGFGLTLMLAAVLVIAQDATMTYLDGDVDIRKESGSTFMADFGEELDAGDRVITGRTGEAELELGSGGLVTVSPDTVFIIGSATGSTGERTSRLSAAVGTFAFKFSASVGNEPRVGSTTSVAGVRGTEVRVYVASDGTTRYEVIEGLVELEDSGERITLGPEQAVEVTPGTGAGSVFAFLERPIDYSVWNAGLVDDFLADPLPALRGVASEMQELIGEIERLGPGVDEIVARSAEESDKLAEIEESEGQDARQKHFREVVAPLRLETRERFVDLRFVVLSALSLDHYVLSRLAAELDAYYFMNPDESLAETFRRELSELRDEYARVVVPRLVPSDL